MTQEKKNELLELINDFGEKSERAGEAGELCSNREQYDDVIKYQYDSLQNLLKCPECLLGLYVESTPFEVN